MHFSCLPLFPFLLNCLLGLVYYQHYLLLGFFLIGTSFGVQVSLSRYDCQSLRYLTDSYVDLVWMSSESYRRVQLIRAELSSNPSLSLLRGSTTAEGLYANIFFVLSHYAFGGVSAQCVLLALGTPLRPRGRIGVFRRREVLLASPSRASPSSASSRSAFLTYEAFPHAEERRLRIRASCGSALPSSGPTSSFLSSSMRMQYLFGGGRTCFPDRDCRRLPESHCVFHRSFSLVLPSLFLPGRPDVFSWSRLCTSSSPLLHSSILLISTTSSCASVAWESTVYGWLDWSFSSKLERWVSGCSRTGLCGPASTRLNPRRLAKPLRVSPLHVCSMDYFPVHFKESSGLGFQRNLELAFSNLSAPAEL